MECFTLSGSIGGLKLAEPFANDSNRTYTAFALSKRDLEAREASREAAKRVVLGSFERKEIDESYVYKRARPGEWKSGGLSRGLK
jgi:hypothetical protein